MGGVVVRSLDAELEGKMSRAVEARRGDVSVMATVGEEKGQAGALSTVWWGYRVDATLITEPTRLTLVPAQVGSLVFRLSDSGRSALAAVRGEGVSALEKLLPIFEDLTKPKEERRVALSYPLYVGMRNKVPINVSVVCVGNWASTVPESLVAEGRIGLILGEEIEFFRAMVAGRIAAVAEHDPWLKGNAPKLEWFGGQFTPAEVPSDASICEALKRAHELATREEPTIEGIPCGADMRLFIRFGDMPCVMYGARDMNVAHAPDEHISVTELLTAASTLACLLADWCGVDEN